MQQEEGGEEVQNDVRQVLIMRWLCRNHSTSAQAGRLESSLAPVRVPIVPYYPFVLREGCSSILRRRDARLQVPATALRAITGECVIPCPSHVHRRIGLVEVISQSCLIVSIALIRLLLSHEVIPNLAERGETTVHGSRNYRANGKPNRLRIV